MESFKDRAETFLQQAEQKYPQPFAVSRDVSCGGRKFPMCAEYHKREDRYLLGIKGRIAKEGLCGEVCYFDCCETLDEQTMEQYAALFRQIHTEQVDAADPSHDYTLISFVLCTDHVSRPVQKKIRRLSDHRQYKNGAYGWSALRVCVVDLSDGKYYCNAMGDGLKNCLTRQELPKERKKWFGLF